MTVTMVSEGPSFHIINETAEQTIAARREAKEEMDSAADAEVVADKKAKVYYTKDCAAPHEIKETDRVVFKSQEEAEQAGYKLGCR